LWSGVDVEEPVEGELYKHTELTYPNNIRANLSAGEYIYYYYTIESTYSNINITLTNYTGSAKIYVSANRRFPTKHTYKWIPQSEEKNHDGTISQTIVLNHRDPDFVVGKYFIGIYAEDQNCDYEISVIDLSKEEGNDIELEQFEKEDLMEEDMLLKSQSNSKIEKEKTNLRISNSIPQKSNGIILSETSPISYQQDYDNLRKILSHLPPEPSPQESNSITCIVRLPSGTNITRRFNVDSPLQQLYDFVQTQALPENGNHKIPNQFFFVTDFPKTEYKNMDLSFKIANLNSKRCNLRIQPL